MRYGLLALGVAVVAGTAVSQGWLERAYDHAAQAALTEDARIAMTLSCDGQSDGLASDCRSLLTKLYLAGSLDPDKTLRTYCESIRNGRWGGSRPAPPELCVERYGGWRGR